MHDRTYALRMIEACFSQRDNGTASFRSSSRILGGRTPRGGWHKGAVVATQRVRRPATISALQGSCNYKGENEIKMTSPLGDRLYRAGLVDETTDVPVAIAWFGSFFSLSEFSRLAAKSKMADHVLTFGADSQPLNLTSPNALLMQLQSYAAKDLSSMQDSARQARQMADASRGKAKGKGKSKDKGEEKGKPRSEP